MIGKVFNWFFKENASFNTTWKERLSFLFVCFLAIAFAFYIVSLQNKNSSPLKSCPYHYKNNANPK